MCGTKVNKALKDCSNCGLNFQKYQKKLENLAQSEITPPPEFLILLVI